jgi:hypothetical protein
VAFEDDAEPRDTRNDAREATAGEEASERGAKENEKKTADGHGDLRWFLKVPALNFAVIAAMTACSARFAPRIPLVKVARGSPARINAERESGTVPVSRRGGAGGGRWARALATAAANFFAWRTVGWDVCGIERSGAWSAAVMLVGGAWRGRRGG